jgi:putative ATPase
MLYAGEDPKLIARRMVIAASEDIGNADPHALQFAVSAAQAVNFVGMPECRIILAQVATYLSCAPKSNACYMGIEKATQDVINIQIKSVPNHLKDCHYNGARELERGLHYQYPHDFEGHYIQQQYLPDELVDRIYYDPSENGVEKRIKESLKRLGKGSVTNGTNSSK